MRKNILKSILLSAAAMLCASCSFLPKEETYSRAPVVSPYQKAEYELTPVLRGDLELIQKVTVTYMPTEQEKLCFELGSEYVDRIYVSQGQQVKAGKLVAELVQDNLKEQIAQQEYELAVLQLKRDQAQENLTLEMCRQEAITAQAQQQKEARLRAHPEYAQLEEEKELLTDAQKREFALNKVEYAKQIQDLEDQLAVQQVTLAELKEELSRRQLYAGMDGTVTYVRKLSDGYRTSAGDTMVVITDVDSSRFSAKGEDALLFEEGMEVTIVSNKKEFAASVSEVAITEEKKNNVATFALDQPDPTLESGDKGVIEVLLEASRDCLYVEKDAVKTANGESFVYVPDSQGLRTIKAVKTGLVSGKYVEITEGLSEGEMVILE